MIIELKRNNEPQAPGMYFYRNSLGSIYFSQVERSYGGGFGMPSDYHGLHVGCTKMCDFHKQEMQWSDKLEFQITVDG